MKNYSTVKNLPSPVAKPCAPFSVPKMSGAFRRIAEYLKDFYPFGHSLQLPAHTVRSLADSCNAERWHIFAVNKRMWRRHICIACGWAARYFPRSASVFEPACGSGANLLWLASKGFSELRGADIDPKALALSRLLQENLRHPLRLRLDNALQPRHLPAHQDLVLSLNWLYHIPGASLEDFLTVYKPCLKKRGFIICDLVDKAYNRVKGNMFHTQDLHKPRSARRASEYTFRMSGEEVENTAAKNGFSVVRATRIRAVPQRAVYMLRLDG